MEDESLDLGSLKPRKIPPQNIIIKLNQREIYGCRKPGTSIHVTRSFYQNVFPNFTIMNVEKPGCFLRKFSPDGRHFVAFSSDQTSIEVYEYMGAAAAEDLLQGIDGDIYPQAERNVPLNQDLRSGRIFERFFRLKHTIPVAVAGEQLNRECSLFTDDGKLVIVGSAAPLPDDPHPHVYSVYRTNESVSPNLRSPLEDFTLHLVDMEEGKSKDKITFKTDKIFLSHNQGLYLFRDIMTVLSVQHQLIHVYRVLDFGVFAPVKVIGRFCFDNDSLLVSAVWHPRRNRHAWDYREECIGGLKHRILVFLYRRAASISKRTNDPYELRRFYLYFDYFKNLKMWKMQILDEDHLLIKYASHDVVTQRTAEPNSQPSFFVVYRMEDAKVLAVYENTSEAFLSLFENFCDLFRNTAHHPHSQFTCSPSSNLFARLQQQRFKQNIISARYGGTVEAVKRLLAQVPISSQSYSPSPYLDLQLFSYDDKWVGVMERPKQCGDHPIRFYGRDSGILKFRIYPGMVGRQPPPSARRLVAFTFHPSDPFAISVQRTNADYVVNFHIRH